MLKLTKPNLMMNKSILKSEDNKILVTEMPSEDNQCLHDFIKSLNKKDLFTLIMFDIKPALAEQVKEISLSKNIKSDLTEIDKMFLILDLMLEKL